MDSGFHLGRIFNIPLRLHYSWFIIFVLITISLIAYPSGFFPLWQRVVYGVIASLFFFSSIIAHELMHSLTAIRYGIPVKGINLFVFGGVAQITREATRPIIELVMAMVGPLSSLAIAGAFYGVYLLLSQLGQALMASLVHWLAFVNVLLALFNLVPGFPLDGGRVLRAVIWAVTRSYYQATRIAVLIGRGIAFLFILGGIVIMIIGREWFAGLWLILIGWFLENAASSSYQQFQWREALQGFTVRDVMTSECPFVSREITLSQLIRDYILATGRRCFIVTKDDQLEGIITLQDVKALPQQSWSMTLVGEAMTPLDRLKLAHPNDEAFKVLEMMDEGNINQIPVIEGKKVIGVVARDGLIRFLRLRSELGI